MQSPHSFQPDLDKSPHSGSDNHLSGLQTQNTNLEELLQEFSTDNDWLSSQFDRLAFLLYKYWLALNFLFVLIIEYFIVGDAIAIYGEVSYGRFQIAYTSLGITFMLFLFGSGEMFFAINTRKSRIAQRGFLKFQYYLIGSIIGIIVMMIQYGTPRDPEDYIQYSYLAITPVVHLIGGHAVVKVFKKNHPLVRQADVKIREDFNSYATDLLEQNKVIALEIAKCEERLSWWSYVVFNWWLKFATVFEISIMVSYLLYKIVESVQKMIDEKKFSVEFLFCIGVLVLSFFNAYSRFAMEIAIRTRSFVRSQRAVLLLKICIASSTLPYFFVARDIDTNAVDIDNNFIQLPSYIFWFAGLILVSVVTFIGARIVNVTIKERDSLVKVSSFAEDSYL